MPRCSLCELLVCELDGLVKGFLGGLLALHGEGDLLLEVLVAVVVGKLVAERAVAKGISEVVFDRGGYLYHGRVKALADSARENGLKF